jgi:hypothetical protein
MLKIRVREYTPAGVKGRVLTATDITYTNQLNGTPTLTFNLSLVESGKM